MLYKCYLPLKTFAFVFELVVHLLADSLRFQNLFVTLHLSLNFADLLLQLKREILLFEIAEILLGFVKLLLSGTEVVLG